MTRKRKRDRNDGAAKRSPPCPTCGRAFADVFDVPRVAVLAVEVVESSAKAEDWMAAKDRRHGPAKSLPGLLKTRSIVDYIAKLKALVGKTVKPSALKPRWWPRSEWPSPRRVPAAPKAPSDDWTFWTLGFWTEWDARGLEACLIVNAAIGGHSLGGQYGPVTVEVAPLIRVRVVTHPRAPTAPSNMRPRISDRCQRLFDRAFRQADEGKMAPEVMLWALHETFVATREHPDWSQEQVWDWALTGALFEWDLC